MKLSELVSAVGDDNIAVQNIEHSLVGASLKKDGVTHITFGTQHPFMQDNSKLGLVLWIPKDKIPKT